MDRFGLRAVVRGLADTVQRYRAYEHAVSYRNNPEAMAGLYAEATLALAAAVEQAQACLREVTIGPEARELGLGLIENLGIHSTRAEITLFEAARARAAADDRVDVDAEDIRAVARLSLRFRGGNALQDFFGHLHEEDARITSYLDGKQ
jgi:magnesium chelatase subunit I